MNSARDANHPKANAVPTPPCKPPGIKKLGAPKGSG